MLRQLILLVSTVLLLNACSSSSKTPSDSHSGTHSNRGGYDNSVGVSTIPQIMPGSQEDLSVNVGDRVFFGYDSSILDADAQATLQRQVAWLNRYPNISVVVEGHCDERGTREYNIALGERRAVAVKNYLVNSGINPMRLRVVSYGKERPALLGSSPAVWKQNRRGVLVID